MEESNPYRYQHLRVQTGSPTSERHLPEMKKATQLRSLQYGVYYNQYRTNTQTQSASPMITMILLIDAPELKVTFATLAQ